MGKLLAGVLAVLSLPVSPAHAGSGDFESWLKQGILLRKQERFLEAEDVLTKALALKPSDPDVEYELAQVYGGSGRDEKEVRLLNDLLEKQPRNYSLYFQLAHALTRLGRRAEAKEVFARAKKLDGAQAQAYREEGYFYLNSGEPAHAKEDFESAVAVDTANPWGYRHLGSYLAQSQQYPQAEEYFRRALEKQERDPNPDDILDTIGWLGLTLLRQGRSTEAESVLRKCLERPAPTFAYVRCLEMLGGLYVSRKQPARAEETFKRAASACEKGPVCSCRGKALVVLGRFYFEQGRRGQADDLAAEVARSCSVYHGTFDLGVFMDLAGLYGDLGEASKEEESYDRVMAERWSISFGWALPDMARADMRRGRFQEAESLYRQGAEMFKDRGDGRQEAAMLDGLAAACEKEGKPREAAAASARARTLRGPP